MGYYISNMIGIRLGGVFGGNASGARRNRIKAVSPNGVQVLADTTYPTPCARLLIENNYVENAIGGGAVSITAAVR